MLAASPLTDLSCSTAAAAEAARGQAFSRPSINPISAVGGRCRLTGRRVVHRFKFGISTDHPDALTRVPSVTFISGASGDAVAFPRSTYLSWYPTGLVSQEVAISPSRRAVPETAAAPCWRIRESVFGKISGG